MINIINTKKYCSEDISLIENYDKANEDLSQTWHIHHKKETDEGLSVKQLKELGLYFYRPASELIFLTRYEHNKLHCKLKNHSTIVNKNQRQLINIMKRDLRKKSIVVEYNNEVKHYDSLQKFVDESEFNYQTVLNWLKGYNKPSIDIKVYYA